MKNEICKIEMEKAMNATKTVIWEKDGAWKKAGKIIVRDKNTGQSFSARATAAEWKQNEF